MRRILVLRGGALGDFIVTLPALRTLRQGCPGARIELVGNATAADLGLADGLLDAVHSQHEARWSSLHAPAPLPASLADWLAGFDLVLNFWPDPDGDLRRHFPVRPGQRYLSAPAAPARAPAAAHYCDALRPLRLETADYFHRLARTENPVGNRIALHPGSGSPAKNWPRERWSEVARWLSRERLCELLIVSGPAEPAETLAEFGRPARNLPLPELAAQLARCRLFVGHDSGVSHLAAALGVPCVLLFGPTDPAMWAPPAAHARVLRRGPDLASISVADVLRELTADQ